VTASLDRLASAPGVRDSAAGNVLPAIDSNATRAIEVAGQPIADPSTAPRVDYRTVTPRYFEVLRMPIASGRAFTSGDVKSAEPVVVVSQSMAKKFWPGGSAIGRLQQASRNRAAVRTLAADVRGPGRPQPVRSNPGVSR